MVEKCDQLKDLLMQYHIAPDRHSFLLTRNKIENADTKIDIENPKSPENPENPKNPTEEHKSCCHEGKIHLSLKFRSFQNVYQSACAFLGVSVINVILFGALLFSCTFYSL